MWIGASVFLAFIWGLGFGDGMSNFDNRIKIIKKASELKSCVASQK